MMVDMGKKKERKDNKMTQNEKRWQEFTKKGTNVKNEETKEKKMQNQHKFDTDGGWKRLKQT